jgi:hypothetical protein
MMNQPMRNRKLQQAKKDQQNELHQHQIKKPVSHPRKRKVKLMNHSTIVPMMKSKILLKMVRAIFNFILFDSFVFLLEPSVAKQSKKGRSAPASASKPTNRAGKKPK